jgi:hypothetical protein
MAQAFSSLGDHFFESVISTNFALKWKKKIAKVLKPRIGAKKNNNKKPC